MPSLVDPTTYLVRRRRSSARQAESRLRRRARWWGEPPVWSLPSLESASGCFETMRAYHGQIFRLDAHVERLYASAHYLGVRIPEDPRAFGKRLIRALERSGIREAVVRVALIPNGKRVASPSIVVQAITPPAPALYRRGIHVAVVPTRKFGINEVNPQAKYSARMASVFAAQDARLRHANEAIFMDAMGLVTESTASNLGIIKTGTLLTPPCWLGLLAGITRQVVLELCARLTIPARETPLTRHDLYNADEAFLSSTIKEVLAVTQIDHRRIGTGTPGPITMRLHRAFRQLIQQECNGHR